MQFMMICRGKTITLSHKKVKNMRKKEAYNSIIEICPVRNVIARFGNKWALLVLLVISENNPVRFNELSRLIPDVSTRVLSNTLKVLEADGLITRTLYPQVPPRVEYSMTATGLSLIPIILQLTVWAKENMKTVMDHRRKFEEGSQNKKDSASHCPSDNN